jgi:hypothetical protein
VTFDRSLAAFGTEAFVGLFAAEVREQAASVPLHKGCTSGGYPDAESLKVFDVRVLEESASFLRIAFSASFIENRPAGCGGGDILDEHRFADFRVTITRATATGTIAHIEAEPAEEF